MLHIARRALSTAARASSSSAATAGQGRRAGGCLRSGMVTSSGCGAMDESAYHIAADARLDALTDALEALEDDHEGIEANFSDGVLSVAVAGHGTWVVNKQAPSRQLWWSSPLSGPLRFDLVSNDDPEARVWHNGRRDVELNALLRTEMDATLGVEVEVPEDAS